MTLVTKDFNKVILKHAKHFLDLSENSRDVTKHMHFLENGSIFLTDAHKGILVRNQHNEEAHTRTVANKKVYADVYSSYSRLFPDNFTAEIEVDVKEALNAAQAFEAVSDIDISEKTPTVRFENKNGQFEMSYRGFGVSGEWQLGVNDQVDLQSNVSVKYTVQIFKILKDFKYQKVTMKFNGHLRPITFSTDDGIVDIILLPVRLPK